MVQGLAFLSKKSWHVKNMANQEKVWIEEQKKAAEENKTKELAKQIQQEREEEELDRIAGKSSNRLDRGIDWMYQGVTSEAAKEDAKKQAEEYLMGKEFTGGTSLQPQGDLAQADDEKEGVNAAVASVATEHYAPEGIGPMPVAAMVGPSVSDRNEAFRVRHEDPMFLVSQKRHENEVKVEKTKALYEKVVGKVVDSKDDEDSESSRKRRKREKKERKKDKKRRKEVKRRRRDRSRSRSDSGDDERYQRGSSEYRKRSKSPDGFNRKSRYDDYGDGEYPRRNRDDRRPRYDSGRRDSFDERRRYQSDSHRSARNRDDDRYQARRRDDEVQSQRNDQRLKSSQYDGEPKRERSGNFGLQGSSKPLDLKDLGPSSDLISQKHKLRDAGRREKPSDRRRMTPEEREQALRNMKNDASKHNANRTGNRPAEREDERKSAAFLHHMAQETHGINGGRSMASRVAQNKHTNQKSTDSFF